MKYRLLFWIVFTVAIIEGVWIYFSNNLVNRIDMAPYQFIDLKNSNPSDDSLVTAQGSWISTTNLAFPLSTVKIECWKDFGHCWIADGTIMTESNYLSVGLNLEEIAEWNGDYITTKPSKPFFGCVEETYRLDRRSKVVTYTRRTVDNTSESCKGVLKEPIVSKLGDGLERIKTYKKNN
jgi:hypothetical protein